MVYNDVIITIILFMVVSSWQSHCESSLGSLDDGRLSTTWPPTHLSLLLGCYTATIHIHHCHLLLLLSSKADTHFAISWRVEGLSWPRHCSKGAQPKLLYCSSCDKHVCLWWVSDLGSL